MQSDARVGAALTALSAPIERYRSVLAAAVEEVRGYLATHKRQNSSSDDSLAAELGAFAADRINLDRYAKFEARSKPLDDASLERVEGAFQVLQEAVAGGDDMFCVDIPSGGLLRQGVSDALAHAGRVLGAARLVSDVRRGSMGPAGDGIIGPLDFEDWTQGERRYAPPLVVSVDGADLRASDIASFLDDGIKIVLVVRGACTPAPLVRLITPGTFVVQTADEAHLELLSDVEGPAVAALVEEGAVQFIHDPSAGRGPAERIELLSAPEEPSRSAIGGVSVKQQAEELEQLLALSKLGTTAVPEAEGAVGGGDPVDRLASWLLRQADLSDLN